MGIGLFAGLSKLNSGSIIALADLLSAAAILMTTSAVTVVCMIAGLSSWLARLTAFTCSFMQLPIGKLDQSDKTTVKQSQQDALTAVKSRKGFLAKFWVLITLALSPLLICFLVAGGIKVFSMPGAGVYRLPLPVYADWIFLGLAWLLFLIMMEISLVALVVSSVSTRSAFAATGETFRLSFKYLMPCLGLSVLVLAANSLLSMLPEIILHGLVKTVGQTGEISLMVVTYFWQSATSVVLLPLTIVPFGEYLRGRINV